MLCCLAQLTHLTPELYKSFVNKKLSEVISGVNAASGLAQGAITKRTGGIFKLHDTSLREALANLKGMLAADARGNVESAVTLAGQLGSLTGSVGSDLKSTTGGWEHAGSKQARRTPCPVLSFASKSLSSVLSASPPPVMPTPLQACCRSWSLPS